MPGWLSRGLALTGYPARVLALFAAEGASGNLRVWCTPALVSAIQRLLLNMFVHHIV